MDVRLDPGECENISILVFTLVPPGEIDAQFLDFTGGAAAAAKLVVAQQPDAQGEAAALHAAAAQGL